MHIASRLTIFLLAVVLFAPCIAAQQIDSGAHPGERIYVDAVVTSGPDGPPVENLQQRDFTIFDNGIPQTIASFEAIDSRHSQIAVIIVLDTLTENWRGLGTALTDIKRFLRANGGELRYPTTIDFVTAKGLEFKAGPSRDGKALSASLNSPAASTQPVEGDPGTYPPFQALAELIALERDKPGRKIILFISRGSAPALNPYSTTVNPYYHDSPTEIKLQELRLGIFGNIVQLTRQLSEGQITLYSIDPPDLGVGGMDDVFTKGVTHLKSSHDDANVAPVRSPDDVQWDDLAFRSVAVRSGGLALYSGNDLTASLRQCVSEAAPFYEISFDPMLTDDPNRYHQLKVEIAKPGLHARTRQGYYSQPWPGAQRAADTSEPANSSVPPLQEPALDIQEESEDTVKKLNPQIPTYVDMPLQQLVKLVPDLKSIQPSEDQKQLPAILKKAGHSVDVFIGNVGDLIADEDVTQQRLNADGKVKAKLRTRDDYLILHHGYEWGASSEYRMDKSGNRLGAIGLEKGYLVTAGYALNSISFGTDTQSQSNFRYLGDQKLGARDAFVLAFAQRPGEVTFSTVMRGTGIHETEMYTQGILWIDKNNFQILRLRSDLLEPNKEIRLNRATTDVSFSQVQLQNNPEPLWLPNDVTVFIEIANEKYRNLHHYTNYRRYQVAVKIGNSP